MKKPTPNLTHLLNKVAALLACGAGSEKELVAFVQRRQPQVNDWIKRRLAPSGEATLQLAAWVTLKEAEMSIGDTAVADWTKIGNSYNREFRRLSKEYPAEK